jgi:hypothetical protein
MSRYRFLQWFAEIPNKSRTQETVSTGKTSPETGTDRRLPATYFILLYHFINYKNLIASFTKYNKPVSLGGRHVNGIFKWSAIRHSASRNMRVVDMRG